MKYRNGKYVMFACDKCERSAGADPDESKALASTRALAKAEGWKFVHPGWGLLCPNCKGKDE